MCSRMNTNYAERIACVCIEMRSYVGSKMYQLSWPHVEVGGILATTV